MLYICEHCFAYKITLKNMKKIITALSATLITINLSGAMTTVGGEVHDMNTTNIKNVSATGMSGTAGTVKIDAAAAVKVENKMMLVTETENIYDSTNAKSKKEDIKKLQAMLIENGYLKTSGNKATGTYGPMTKKAMLKYKESKMMKKEMKHEMMKKEMKNEMNSEMKHDMKASGTMMMHN